MKAAIKKLLVVIALAVAKWVLKRTEYCVATTFGIETAEAEANELLRYAEVSGNLGYRTHARSRVRNSAQHVLDALRLPPKPQTKSRVWWKRRSKGLGFTQQRRGELAEVSNYLEQMRRVPAPKPDTVTQADVDAVAGDFKVVGDDLARAIATFPSKE